MKNGTMGDKTQGGRKKFSVCLEDERKKNDWCKEQKNRKDRITYVDKSTHNTPSKVRVRLG